MDQQWNSPNDMSAMSPPVEGGALEETPSKWPTVIGVIGIILASLGLICGCSGYFTVPIQRWAKSMQPANAPSNTLMEVQLQIGQQYQLITMILTTIGLGMSFWLLLASITLVRRRRSARKTIMAWAIASLFMFAVTISYQVLIFQATTAELQQRNEGNLVNQMWLGAAIGGCFAILLGIAYQVFMLIWMSRSKIKNEVAQWR